MGKLKPKKERVITVTNPELLSEWDYEKNIDIKPEEVTYGSKRKVWWKCSEGHSWDARVFLRVRGSGCPECRKELKTSFPEQTIFYYLQQVFSDAQNRYQYIYESSKVEFDIFIPSLNLAIEYDGSYYHKKERVMQRDVDKNLLCSRKGITLIRVREEGCPDIPSYESITLLYSYRNNHMYLEDTLNELFNLLVLVSPVQKSFKHNLLNLNINIKNDRPKIYQSYSQLKEENSLATCYPEIAEEWDYKKNEGLTPNKVSYGASISVHWTCPNNHSYETTVNSRTNGTGSGCPYCSGKQVSSENSLAFRNPDIAKQWHPTKNINLTPEDVTWASQKKVWWQCDKGHEWEANIKNRTRGKQGCKECSKLVVKENKQLAIKFPDISLLWHPSNPFLPTQVSYGSAKKVKWLCEKGHEWIRSVKAQTISQCCPDCKKAHA